MTEPKTPRCDTLVSLRDHIDQRFEDGKEALKQAKELMEARMAAAHIENERRLHDLNRLRENVMTRSEFESAHQALAAEYRAEAKGLRGEVDLLNKWIARTEGIATGKAGQNTMYFAVTTGLLGLIISLVGLAHQLMSK